MTAPRMWTRPDGRQVPWRDNRAVSRDCTPVPVRGDIAPAAVIYWNEAKAVVLHPEGAAHPNAVATRARLERRGVAVVQPPDDPAELEPYIRRLPWLARLAIRRIIAKSCGPAPAEGAGAA